MSTLLNFEETPKKHDAVEGEGCPIAVNGVEAIGIASYWTRRDEEHQTDQFLLKKQKTKKTNFFNFQLVFDFLFGSVINTPKG